MAATAGRTRTGVRTVEPAHGPLDAHPSPVRG